MKSSQNWELSVSSRVAKPGASGKIDFPHTRIIGSAYLRYSYTGIISDYGSAW